MAANVLVECDPSNDIIFSGDFQRSSVQTLHITNKSSNMILYKVKTTSPHRYVVKPHKGKLEPHSQVEIAITLLPFHYKPQEKYKDKFLLQACCLNKMNEEYLKHDFWSMVPNEERYERKFGCVFRYENPASEVTTSTPTRPQQVKPDMEMVDEIFLGDEAKIQKKLREAQQEISTLKARGNELKILNRKLKEEIDRKRHEQEQLLRNGGGTGSQLMQNGAGTGSESAEIPILHLVFICSLTLVIGILTGKLL